MVKWVRSDTDADPLARSGELASEALEIFRRTNNPKGQVKALVAAVPFAGDQKNALLEEAEGLAAQIEDENYAASVVWAQARTMAMRDRPKAAALSRKALDLYRKTGNRSGQAGCLFTLATQPDDYEERLSAATEAAEIYRELDRKKDASRSMSLAIMAANHVRTAADIEVLARQGLKDSVESNYWSQAQRFCEHLADALNAQGKDDEADAYRKRAKEFEADDGLTPMQRWQQDVDMTNMLIEQFRTEGNAESEKMFRKRLEELMDERPTQN